MTALTGSGPKDVTAPVFLERLFSGVAHQVAEAPLCDLRVEIYLEGAVADLDTLLVKSDQSWHRLGLELAFLRGLSKVAIVMHCAPLPQEEDHCRDIETAHVGRIIDSYFSVIDPGVEFIFRVLFHTEESE